jgi:hypothetical protein
VRKKRCEKRSITGEEVIFIFENLLKVELQLEYTIQLFKMTITRQ